MHGVVWVQTYTEDSMFRNEAGAPISAGAVLQF